MNLRQKIIYIYFFILPFIDLITSLITRFTTNFISLGIIIKGITIIFITMYVLFFSKSKYRKNSIIYFFLLGFFLLIYFLLKPDIWQINYIIDEVKILFKYLYFPIMLCGLLNLFDDFKIDNNLIKKILLTNCIIYTLLLLIPYFTGTNFNAYNYESLKGSKGWFYAANEVGSITVILLCSLTFFLDNEKKWKVIFIFPILLSVSLIGTKVSYLGMILVTILVLALYIYRNGKKSIFLSIIAILLLVFSCQFSFATYNFKGSGVKYNDLDKEQEKKPNLDSNEEEFEEEEKLPDEISIPNEKEPDAKTIYELIPNLKVANFVNKILNGRADLFLQNYFVYVDSGYKNILFGLSFTQRDSIGYRVNDYLIEIDFLDIIIHYGIVGFIVYFLPLIMLFINFIKKHKLFHAESLLYLTIILLTLSISSLAGHILAAPAVSIYIVLLLIMVNNYLEDNVSLKKNEITIMALHLNYGGIERYISSLCKMLENDYNINLIVTYKMASKPAFEFSDKINITYLINDTPNKDAFLQAIKNKQIIKIFKEGFKSVKILLLKNKLNIKAIKKIKSQYIITTREFHSKLVGTYANKNIIKIATEHNYHNNDEKFINRIIKSLNNFEYFVPVSENLQKFYASKIGDTKCIFIPNVIDSLPKVKSTLKNNNLISVGRLEKEKGQCDLLDVVKQVKDEIKDVKMYLIGDGSLYKTLKNQIKEMNLEDTIILTGFLKPSEISNYMKDSKLFVMSSYTESFGLVLIEAMSYKVPCIAFDSADGAKEILKNNTGILIKNRNKEEMAKKIIELLKNDKKLKKYSDLSYQKCQEYLAENVKEKWLALLEISKKEKNKLREGHKI